jgi:ABC-type antimicrobial peptide transport system permease subunit
MLRRFKFSRWRNRESEILRLPTRAGKIDLSNNVFTTIWNISPPPRVFLTEILLSGFTSMALLLTGIGVDGTVSYAVAQQVREFGTRIAPGGQRAHVMRIVLLRSMTVTTNGMALGYGGALTQVLRGHWRSLFH